MNLLYRLVALVHIIEEELVHVEQQVAHGDGILARVIHHLWDDDTLHSQVDDIFGTIALNSCHLMEMAQLTSIVGHLDLELSA